MDMAWMETDYSKHTYFRWKVKWRLEHLGALGTMGETPKQSHTASFNNFRGLTKMSTGKPICTI